MITAALIDQITLHEGLRLFPYADTAGKVTIGVGRNLTDVGISHDEAMTLLQTDLMAAITDLSTFPWFATLTDARQLALVDMRFNLGGAGFRKFRGMLAALIAHDYQLAAMQMRKSRWYTQVGQRGETLARMVVYG